MELRPWIAAASLAGLIAIGETTPDPASYERTVDSYVLPAFIDAKDTDLPCKPLSNGNCRININDINFDEDFSIETERYHLTKNEDWLPSRIVGHIMSVIPKVIFVNTKVGAGPDKKLAMQTLAMLEQRKEIYNLTVRLGHNEVIDDFVRLFTDEKVTQRNPFLARATLGVLATTGHELWAELGRGDYYNPLTQTAVVYSNIESILDHEIGHHLDFNRFESDWKYSVVGMIPTSMLAREYRASEHAKAIISKAHEKEYNRNLVPAFATYAMFAAAALFAFRKPEEGTDEALCTGTTGTTLSTLLFVQAGAATYFGLTHLGLNAGASFAISACVSASLHVGFNKSLEPSE